MEESELKDYGAIVSAEKLEILVSRLLEIGEPVGFDIETGYDGEPREKAAVHPEESYIVGFSLTNDPRWARYVPIRHKLSHNVDPAEAARIMKPLLESGLCVAHNAKFEKRHCDKSVEDGGLGCKLAIRSDTMIEAFVLADYEMLGLKGLVEFLFGHEMATIDTLFPDLKGKAKKTLNFAMLAADDPTVVSYACEDAAWCLELHRRHYPKVQDMTIFKMEMAILPILVRMEQNGLSYDWEMMRTTLEKAREFRDRMLREINAELTAALNVPVELNPNSSAQVGKLLYDPAPAGLGLSISRTTPSGKPSTDAVAMEALAQQNRTVRKILEWREVNKLCTTYLEKYPARYRYAADGLTHPNVKQTEVATGRFAVDEPPYQQTPKRYHYELNSGEVFDLNFRNLVVARPGWQFLYFDYSQIELRVMAGESQEPTLLTAFNEDRDVHTETAALMLGKDPSAVTEDDRDIGKTMNFALLYGMGPGSLADRLGISRAAARDLYDRYFSTFMSIGAWADKSRRDGKNQGFTISRFGRKFTIWEFGSHLPGVYAKGERMCVNAPIQGGAADYMKASMIRATKALENAGLDETCLLVMNIHDALVFEIPEDADPQTYIDVLKPAVQWELPGWPKIVAEWGVGKRWGSLQKLKDGEAVQVEAQPRGRDHASSRGPLGEPQAGVQVGTHTYGPDGGTSVLSGQNEYPVDGEPTPTYVTGPEERPKFAPASDDGVALIMEVRLAEDPTQEAVARLVEWITARPGQNTLRLVMPDGEVITVQRTTSAGREQWPDLAMIFPGAQCSIVATDDVMDVMSSAAFG